MDKTWIVVTSHYKLQRIVTGLKENYNVIYDTDLEKTPSELLEKVEAFFFFRVTAPPLDYILDVLPNVKVFVLAGAGHDGLDIQLLKTRGIPTGYCGNSNSLSVAEYAVSLLLAAAKQLVPAVRYLTKDANLAAESTPPSEQFTSNEVTGSTVGIVGMGNIGYLIAKKLAGFDVKILYRNRNRKSLEEEEAVNATFCESLSDLLTQSDYVVISVPNNNDTERMFGAEQFHQMKSSGFIINVARGSIIDQDALVEALQQGGICGAALDVTEPEPLPKDHPLLNMPNVIITPHMAWATERSIKRALEIMRANLRAGINGEPLPLPVPI